MRFAPPNFVRKTAKQSSSDQTYIANILAKNRPSKKLETDEIGEYEVEKPEPANCDPTSVYAYWNSRSHRWPRLACMAREVLSIPATSAASERGFSAGKDVFGIARMSLKPETVEALICLRSWYRAGLVGEKEVEEFLSEDIEESLQEEEKDEEEA